MLRYGRDVVRLLKIHQYTKCASHGSLYGPSHVQVRESAVIIHPDHLSFHFG